MKNIETCFDSFCFRVLQDLETEDIPSNYHSVKTSSYHI